LGPFVWDFAEVETSDDEGFTPYYSRFATEHILVIISAFAIFPPVYSVLKLAWKTAR